MFDKCKTIIKKNENKLFIYIFNVIKETEKNYDYYQNNNIIEQNFRKQGELIFSICYFLYCRGWYDDKICFETTIEEMSIDEISDEKKEVERT